jgi:hypothetical protein
MLVGGSHKAQVMRLMRGATLCVIGGDERVAAKIIKHLMIRSIGGLEAAWHRRR